MKTLNRKENGRPAPPVRIIHLGIGNFTRAHQVWYTEHASDANNWGIAAFTGRTTLAPRQSPRDDALDAQEGLYQLCIQAPDTDQIEVMSAVSHSYRSHEYQAWKQSFADPQVVIVTSTITEKGYCRDSQGNLDFSDQAVIADLDVLKSGDLDQPMFTGPGKFTLGLLARREADGGPITFVPCDNIPENGKMAKRIIRQAAQYVDESLVDWIDENVGFVTTMVDRITPRATKEDIDRVEKETGIRDEGLVVTEPFTEWVLAGEFKTERPQWESAGAQFVDDIVAHETRKLFMLNGSHSLMAYAGSILGHETVFDAINDPRIKHWVEQWWDEAATQLPLPQSEIDAYQDALLDRYNNPRIKHLLAQIANDGTQKLPIRIAPTLRAWAEQDKVAVGAARAVAAWVLHLRGIGAPIGDDGAVAVEKLVTGDLASAVNNIVDWLNIPSDLVKTKVLQLAEELETLKA